MKNINKVKILHWAKTKHRLNIKYIHRSLEEKDFGVLCTILSKIKQIGGVVSPEKVVSEFIRDHGVEYIPKSFTGQKVNFNFLSLTHPMNDSHIVVSLRHLLLNSWCRATRENYRTLKKHLKTLGYELEEKIPTYSKTRKKEAFVLLKSGYDLQLPRELKRYSSPIVWHKEITKYALYTDQPKVLLNEKPYTIKEIGSRWEAYFAHRFKELFEMSEIEYLHRHPKVSTAYESAPPVQILCDLTIRDIFKRTKLKEWVHIALMHKLELKMYHKEHNTEKGQEFLSSVYESILGLLSCSMIKESPLKNKDVVEGWGSIIILCFVNDTLNAYEELL